MIDDFLSATHLRGFKKIQRNSGGTSGIQLSMIIAGVSHHRLILSLLPAASAENVKR